MLPGAREELRSDPPRPGDIASLVQRLLDGKTKPVGSLGILEQVAIQLASVAGTPTPTVDPARIIIFAADHGISEAGVSAYPRSVTREMLRNFSRGGAAINVISRSVGASVEVIDVGVDDEGEELPGIVRAKVRRATRSFLSEAAMTSGELMQAIGVGRQVAVRARGDDVVLLGIGEMGIGNSTSAAALLSAFTGIGAHSTVGSGTGVSGPSLDNKRAVVDRAVAKHAASRADSMLTMQCLGGLEIAAMSGAMMQAAEDGMNVVVDGFISTVAAVFACDIAPQTRPALHFSHLSAEPGHSIALGIVRGRPLLDLGMRLGEATGAALALPILRAAAAVLREMASFEEAGVSRSAQ